MIKCEDMITNLNLGFIGHDIDAIFAPLQSLSSKERSDMDGDFDCLGDILLFGTVSTGVGVICRWNSVAGTHNGDGFGALKANFAAEQQNATEWRDEL